jgi:hypothetical protein
MTPALLAFGFSPTRHDRALARVVEQGHTEAAGRLHQINVQHDDLARSDRL